MRRWMMGIVVVGIVLSAGVGSAQQSGRAMPETVRAFLDNVTGRWTISGSTKGTNQIQWEGTGTILLDTGQFKDKDTSGSWSGVWYWDGLSEDGVIVSWGSPTSRGFGYGQLQGKVLSPTLMEAQRTGVRLGKPVTEKVRVEFQSPHHYTWTGTDITLGGEKQPDYTDIYTRVKTGDTKQEALQAAMGWGTARERKDMAYIDRLLADDLTCVHPDGTTAGKAQLMAVCQSPDYKSVSNDYDLDVRVYGDTAIIMGLLTTKEYFKDNDWSGTIRLTETYVKRDGRWQCVATHASKIAQGAGNKVLEGPWRLVEYDYGDGSEEELQAIKAYWNGTFYCTFYDAETGKIESAHGGTYTYDGKTLAETIGFATVEELRPYLGTTVAFSVDVKDGKFYQSGAFAGTPLKEVWQSVTLKP